MDEIAKAFTGYATLLEHLAWLKENGELGPDTNIGLIEILHNCQERCDKVPKRPRSLSGKALEAHEARLAAERSMYQKARVLAMSLNA